MGYNYICPISLTLNRKAKGKEVARMKKGKLEKKEEKKEPKRSNRRPEALTKRGYSESLNVKLGDLPELARELKLTASQR